jgi:hypothetical protein
MLSKTRVSAALLATVAVVLAGVLPAGGTYWP